VQAKIFFCRNDVQAIDFLRKGSYAPGVHMNYEKFKRSDGPDRFRHGSEIYSFNLLQNVHHTTCTNFI
jgi:hypothetical protein